MLHLNARYNTYFSTLIILGALFLGACKRDSQVQSDEKSAYLADYEVPTKKWGFINKDGTPAIEAVYDDVGPFSEGLAAFNQNGMWGFINREGEVVIQPVYKSAWAFHENKARVQPFDSPEQFIDPKGAAMTGDQWSAADDFSNGRARVKIGNSFGYIDSSGQLVTQPIYTRGWNFRNGICIVEFHEKLGVIDLNGNYILKPEYDFIKIVAQDQMILCRHGNNSFAYNHDGKELASIPDSKLVDSDGHLISVRQEAHMSLYDMVNQKIIDPLVYTNIIYLEDSLWAGKRNEGYFLLDHNGQPVSSIPYAQINKFSDGFAAYSKNEHWGYLDKEGKEMTDPVFGLAWDYREGLARAAFQDGIAFIDLNQKLAFYPPEGCVDMRDFSEGMASVQME